MLRETSLDFKRYFEYQISERKSSKKQSKGLYSPEMTPYISKQFPKLYFKKFIIHICFRGASLLRLGCHLVVSYSPYHIKVSTYIPNLCFRIKSDIIMACKNNKTKVVTLENKQF
uniref:Uncharacterized protein n=1 Tax=Ixodes ricinus TaxID=34613 RepID=A0A0K8RIW7_IXORI